MSFTYEYARPSLTVDVGVLRGQGTDTTVLLIRRQKEPFAGRWALPGGFVEEGEKVEEGARRELKEETSITVGPLQQLGTYGDPGRDPRGWTVSVVYFTHTIEAHQEAAAGDDAEEVGWFSLLHPPPLAFDHAQILADLRTHLGITA